MKKLFLPILLLAGFDGLTQRMDKPIVDKLSGDTAYQTTTTKIYSALNLLGVAETLEFWFVKAGSTKRLILAVQTAKTNTLFISAGDALQIKLASGEILTLTAAGNRMSERPSPTTRGSRLTSAYSLSAADIALLKAEEVSFIRLSGSGSVLDYDIKEKNAGKMKAAAALIF